MDFSNRHTNEFVNLCDLENVLGGVFACHEEIAGAEEYCVNVDYKGITKRFSPRPKLGEGRVRVHSDINNYCHSVLDTESEVGEWINTNKNSPRHICESTEATPLCHAELVSASYQRGVDNFNVNTFLKQIYTFITGQILSQAQNDTKGMASFDHLRHCCTCQAIPKDLVGWGFHPNIGGVK